MELLIYGEEPFLCQREFNRYKGNSTVFEDFGPGVVDACMTESIFNIGQQRRVLVLLDELKKDELLENYLKEPCETADLIVYAKKINRNTKVFKCFSKKVECKKLDKPELAMFIKNYVIQEGREIEPAALEEYIARSGYSDEGKTLYDVVSDLKNLIAYDAFGKVITEDSVKILIQNLSSNVFQLANLYATGQYKELLEMSQRLASEKDFNVIGVLSLFLSNFKRGYSQQILGNREYSVVVPDGYTAADYTTTICLITDGIRDVKSGKLPERSALQSILARLISY